MLFGEFAKSQAEAEYPELWRGLVGAWSPCLSPRGGTVLRDLSGRGNHGTLTNMDAATDWVTSGGKTALDFDGSNDRVQFNVPATEFPITINAWCVMNNTTADHTIVSLGTPGAITPFIRICASGYYGGKWLLQTQSRDLLSTQLFSSGVLYLVTGIWASSTYRAIMVNGSQLAESTFSGASSGWTNGLVGALDYSPSVIQHLNGYIYDVTIIRNVETLNTHSLRHRLGPGGWATPRRRRRYGSSAVIPYWAFRQQRSRIIGGGVS